MIYIEKSINITTQINQRNSDKFLRIKGPRNISKYTKSCAKIILKQVKIIFT